MAAVMNRTEIGIKKTGSSTTVPNDPKAKLMYYFDCICSCVEPENDSTIRRLRDYKNYWSITSAEEAQLMILCLALSPDKLIGSILFPADKIEGKCNQFLELSAVNTKMVVAQSLLIGGQQKRVQKIMLFEKVWIERYYLEPLRSYERNQRPALRSPPQRQRSSSSSSCTIL